MPLKNLDKSKKLTKKQKTTLVASGLFVGFLNGFFGGGGGMLGVPALTLSGLPQRKAHATAIAVILPLSVVSAVVYMLKAPLDPTVGFSVGGGVVLGGIIGACLLKKISGKWLSLIFYGIMIAAGIRMVM